MLKYFCPIILALLVTSQVYADNYYWIGGSGDWSDISHWATSSGGSITHLTTPSAGDRVFFDANSFTGTNQEVTISGNIAFALDLSFVGVQFTPRLLAGTNTTLQIHGSLQLASDMVFDFLGNVEFAGSGNVFSIDFAGHDAGSNLIFSGDGTWNIAGNVNVSNTIEFNSGTLNLNNSRILCEYFHSNTSNQRILNFSNSEIRIFGRTNDPYFLGSQFNSYSIEINTTNWESTSENSHIFLENDYAKIWLIGSGNPVFGSITANNPTGNFGIIHYQQFPNQQITIVGNLEIRNNGQLYTNLEISGDIILAPAKRYEFQSGKDFRLRSIRASADCGNIISVRASASGEVARIFSTENYTISFVSLQDMSHQGMTGTVNNGLNLGNNPGWVINEKATETLYWVGNNEVWSNPANWSFASGGAGSGCIPTIVDNVVFDDNSFQNNNQLVQVDIDNASCRDMTWSGIRTGCGISGTAQLNIFVSGSVVFSNVMINQFEGDFHFIGTGMSKTIRSNGIRFMGNIHFDNRDAGWVLQDDIYVQKNFYFDSGLLDFNGVTADLHQFISEGSNLRTLLLRNSTIYLRERNFFQPQWRMWSDNHTLDAGTSEIVFDTETGYFYLYGSNSLRFYNIRFFTLNESIESYLLNQPAIANTVQLSGYSYMTGQFVMDTLILDAGGWHYFDERSEKTVGFLSGNAGCDGMISMAGIPALTEPARIRFLENQILSGFFIKDITALSPSGTITAINSVNGGGNSGFTFTSATGRTLYWVNDSGDWYDPAHWSLTSGGPGGECPPTPLDNVVIDNQSFTINDGFIFSGKRTGFVRDFTFNRQNFNGYISMTELKVFGSLRLQESLNFQIGQVQMEGNAVEQRIFSGGNSLINLYVAATGTVFIEENTIINQYFFIFSGMVMAQDISIRTRYFNLGNFYRPPDISLINCNFEIFGEHLPFNSPFSVFTQAILNTTTSVIRLSNQQTGMSFRYGNINLGEVLVSDPTSFADLSFFTAVNIRKLILRGSALFKGFYFSLTGELVSDSLILTAGRSYQFQSGSSTRINSYLQARGNNCNPIGMSSTIINDKAFLNMNNNTNVNADFIEMRDITAIGGLFNAGPYSTDINNSNSGWFFPDPNQVSDDVGFLGPDRFLCEGAKLILDANNYTPTETYLWSNGLTSATIEVDMAGIYFVEINFGNNCIVRDTIEVFSPQSFNDFLPQLTVVCDNIPIQLDADLGVNGASYQWQDGSNNSGLTVQQSGQYSVTVTIDGCEYPDTAEVIFIDIPKPDFEEIIRVCDGDIVNLSIGSFAGTIEWSTGSNAEQINVSTTGDYWVTLSQDGCTLSDTVSVVFNPLPIFSFSADRSICEGDNVVLNPGISGATVLWQDGSSTETYTVSQSGMYSAVVMLDGCSYEDEINILVNPLPVFSLGDDIRPCAGETIVLSADIPGAVITWQDGTVGTLYNVVESGTYNATATLNGCNFTDEIFIEFTVLPTVDLGNDTTLCENQSLTLEAPPIAISIQWSTGSNEQQITVNQAGIYWLEVSEGACSTRDSLVITFAPSPMVGMPLEYTLCRDSTIIITPSGVFDLFTWTGTNSSEPLAVSAGGMYDYSVLLGNCSDTGEVVVNEIALPNIDLGQDLVICRQEELTLTPVPFRADYIWQDGSVAANFRITESGTYSVTLEESGCTTMATVSVTVEECNDIILTFPNVFAPDLSGVNGEFRPVKGSDVQILDYNLSIYDRWGNLLFVTNDYLEAWNGTYNNSRMNPGVYIYRAKGRYSFGNQEQNFDIKGDITILR